MLDFAVSARSAEEAALAALPETAAGRGPIKRVRGRIVLAVDVTAWLRPDANCSWATTAR
ncbi:hypothetical protein [Glycomyces tarimensis]